MKRTRLKPRSTSRRLETEQRLDCVDLVLTRARWMCEARDLIPGVQCRGLLVAHEVVQRSVRPGSHLEPLLQVAVCAAHHSHIHDHIAESHANGLLRHSWDVNPDGTLKPMEADDAA